MKRVIIGTILVLICGMLLTACGMLFPSQDAGLESTRVALAIQQTSLAMSQAQGQEAQPPAAVPEQPAIQPTYTAYPTYTVEVVEQPPEPEPEQTEEPEPEPAQSFEDWLDGVKILIYDDMWGDGEEIIVEDALDALGISLGYGTEYRVSEQFSIGGEVFFTGAYWDAEEKGSSYYAGDWKRKTKAILGGTLARATLNYYFK